jgi:vancomycin permeability regulator SanA
MKRIRLKTLLSITAAISGLIFLLSATAIVWDGLHDELGVSDVAIVLGNQVNSDGRPSERLRARLDVAVTLYQQGWFTHILVSGGTGRNGFDEAEVMKKYLVEKGVPEEIVVVDSDGVTTYHTAKNAAQLMREKNWQHAMVISQYFHISRTKLAHRRFGISSVYSAHAPFFEARDFYSTAREVVGFYAYLFRSYER